jgi:hypothetical protein
MIFGVVSVDEMTESGIDRVVSRRHRANFEVRDRERLRSAAELLERVQFSDSDPDRKRPWRQRASNPRSTRRSLISMSLIDCFSEASFPRSPVA